MGNKYGRTLTPDQVAAAIKFTTLKPQEREQFTRQIDFIRPTVNKPLAQLGMQFSNDLLTVDAHRLPPPGLQFAKYVLCLV